MLGRAELFISFDDARRIGLMLLVLCRLELTHD